MREKFTPPSSHRAAAIELGGRNAAGGRSSPLPPVNSGTSARRLCPSQGRQTEDLAWLALCRGARHCCRPPSPCWRSPPAPIAWEGLFRTGLGRRGCMSVCVGLGFAARDCGRILEAALPTGRALPCSSGDLGRSPRPAANPLIFALIFIGVCSTGILTFTSLMKHFEIY